MNIPDELVASLTRGNAVLFVGAGLSVGAGLPGWGQLIEPLADRLGLPANQHGDPLQMAQFYETQRGRQALISYIQERTDTSSSAPTENHRRLTQLGIRTWLTTNFDDLLEQTLRNADERVTKVVRDHDLPYAGAERLTLIKLHGDSAQPETIVITRQDYNTYARRFPRVKEKLSGLLVDKTFLLIGYSIPEELLEQAERGNVLLFVGERVVRDANGLVVIDQLTAQLAARGGLADAENTSFPEAAQLYEDTASPKCSDNPRQLTRSPKN